MATIHLRHRHPLSDAKARATLTQIAEKLATRFGVQSAWDGDTLNFNRSGVEGQVRLHPSEIEIEARLGLLASAMKTTVEGEIQRLLKEKF